MNPGTDCKGACRLWHDGRRPLKGLGRGGARSEPVGQEQRVFWRAHYGFRAEQRRSEWLGNAPAGTESGTEWRCVWGCTDRSCWWARCRVWERKIQVTHRSLGKAVLLKVVPFTLLQENKSCFSAPDHFQLIWRQKDAAWIKVAGLEMRQNFSKTTCDLS